MSAENNAFVRVYVRSSRSSRSVEHADRGGMEGIVGVVIGLTLIEAMCCVKKKSSIAAWMINLACK